MRLTFDGLGSTDITEKKEKKEVLSFISDYSKNTINKMNINYEKIIKECAVKFQNLSLFKCIKEIIFKKVTAGGILRDFRRKIRINHQTSDFWANLNNKDGKDAEQITENKEIQFLLTRSLEEKLILQMTKKVIGKPLLFVKDKAEGAADSKTKALKASDDIDTRNQRTEIKVRRKPWHLVFKKREVRQYQNYLSLVLVKENHELNCKYVESIGDTRFSLSDYLKGGLNHLKDTIDPNEEGFQAAKSYFSCNWEGIGKNSEDQKRKAVTCNKAGITSGGDNYNRSFKIFYLKYWHTWQFYNMEEKKKVTV